MSKVFSFAMAGFLLSITALSVTWAVDQSAPGAVELKLLESLITGNLGLFVGMVLALLGIWKIITGGTASGITLLVVAVVITMLPVVFNGVTLITCPIAKSLGSNVTCSSAPL